MSKKSSVGRDEIFFLPEKPEIVVPGSGIRYFIFDKMMNYAVFLSSLLSISTKS
jgi:hypothetical protein